METEKVFRRMCMNVEPMDGARAEAGHRPIIPYALEAVRGIRVDML